MNNKILAELEFSMILNEAMAQTQTGAELVNKYKSFLMANEATCGLVNSFVKEHDYKAVRELQSDIIRMYRNDFSKHIPSRDFSKVCLVFDSIAVQLAKENKKFFFGNVKKGARSSDFENAIEWLMNAGLVHKVSKVNEPHVPLAAYKDISSYKLFFLDVGLLGAMTELDPISIIEGNQLFIEFKGALTEQYVLQELKAQTNYTPYYFSTSSSRFEQDFIIQKDGRKPVRPAVRCCIPDGCWRPGNRRRSARKPGPAGREWSPCP